jgi:hypothetical protein
MCEQEEKRGEERDERQEAQKVMAMDQKMKKGETYFR